MDFESENAKEWTGDPTKSSGKVVDKPVKQGLPSRAAQANPSTNLRRGQKPVPWRKPIPMAALTNKFVPRKPRQTPVQVRGSYVKESNRFVLNQDNAGKDAWRRRRQPDGQYKLPPHVVAIYNSLDRGPRTGVRHTKSTALKSVLEQIGIQTGAFIEIPARTSDRDLLIWGNTDQVRAAKQQIESWININKTPRKDWAKVVATSDKKKRQLDKKMLEEAFEESWRRHPKEGEHFEWHGIYVWPKDGFPPTELLGQNLEALDAIRMKNHCHILFQPEKQCISVMSGRPGAVDQALRRIHATLREMIVRSQPPTKVYMIEPPKPEDIGREVQLIPYNHFINNWVEDWQDDGGVIPNVVPIMTGPPPTEEDKLTWVTLSPKLAIANQRALEGIVGYILYRMRWYRAHIRMRVNFGIMSLSSYRLPGQSNHTLEGFQTMIKNYQTAGDVVAEIEEHDGGASLISRCREAINVLDPVDAVTLTLADVEPEFSASFELGFVGRPGTVRLDVAFAKNNGGQYELASSRWLRAEERNPAARDMAADLRKERVAMSICTMDLQRKTAWELEVSCRNIIPEGRVTAAMRDFADRVRLEIPRNTTQDAGNIATPSVFVTQNEIRMDSYKLKTHYRFLLKRSTYVLEITRTQKFERGSSGQMNQTGTSWRASMYNVEWDTHLDQQATLGIGEIGQWNHRLPTFFPPAFGDGDIDQRDGIAHFYAMVRAASRLVERRSD